MKKTWMMAIVIVIGIMLIPIQKNIVFEYENTGKVLGYMKVGEKDPFAVRYTHSIHLSDVVETYELNAKGQIVQKQLEYENFAIGMPSNAEGNETFVKKDGRYFIMNMNRTFDYLDLRIGQVVANHTIIYQQRELPLSSFIKEGSWTRIHYRSISLWDMLKGVNILEQR